MYEIISIVFIYLIFYWKEPPKKPIAAKNGSVVAPAKKNKAASSSSDSSDSDSDSGSGSDEVCMEVIVGQC